MENVTIGGMKEINQKLGHIERHLEDISKSLALIAKVLNKQVPTKQKLVTSWDPVNGMDMHLEDEEDDDE